MTRSTQQHYGALRSSIIIIIIIIMVGCAELLSTVAASCFLLYRNPHGGRNEFFLQ